MSETPSLRPVERSVLTFLASRLDAGQELVSADDLKTHLKSRGAESRALAIAEYFETLGVLEHRTEGWRITGRAIQLSRTLPPHVARMMERMRGKLTTAVQANAMMHPPMPPAALLDPQGAGAGRDPADAEQAEGDAPPARRSKRIPKEEADVLVREWLATHANKDNADDITRDEIAADTGISAGGVSKAPAWIAFRDARKARRKPGARDIPLTDKLLAAVPSDCETPAEIAALIEEQAADEGEQERRHERRHGSS